MSLAGVTGGMHYHHLAAASNVLQKAYALAPGDGSGFRCCRHVGTVIGAGLEELIEQIAISGMQLHTIKTG